MFAIDWRRAGQSMDRQTRAGQLVQPWQLSAPSIDGHGTWQPDGEVLAAMIRIFERRELDEMLADPEQAALPEHGLEIVALTVPDKVLRAGADNALRLELSNRGPGRAYGVSARTFSDIASLHGLEFRFHGLEPDEQRSVSIRVNVPGDVDTATASIAIAVSEAFSRTETIHLTSIPVEGATPRTPGPPRLQLQCAVDQRDPCQRRDVMAGELLHVRCTLFHTGEKTIRSVHHFVEFAGRKGSIAVLNLQAGAEARTTSRIAVPRRIRIGESGVAHAYAQASGLPQAHVEIPFEVGRAARCTCGKQVDRALFNQRSKKLLEVYEQERTDPAFQDRMKELLLCLE